LDPQSVSVVVTKSNVYKYYSGYLPMEFSFNEDLILAKAIQPSETGPNEAVLLFDRKDTSNQFLTWGMKPAEYYNKVPKGPVQITSSTPMVAKVDGSTHIFMTQYVITDGDLS
jgi:hypothetical protein